MNGWRGQQLARPSDAFSGSGRARLLPSRSSPNQPDYGSPGGSPSRSHICPHDRAKAALVAAVVVLAMLYLSPAALLAQDGRAFQEQYGLVVQRNIFARDRGRPAPRPPATREAPPPPSPEQSLVLTGTVEAAGSGQFVAFVEDRRSRTTSKLRAGDAIVGGRIAAVGFGFVEYEAGGQTRHIDVGMSLAGGAASATPAAVNSGGSSGSSGGSGGGGGDVLERLRQRRLQELNR